MGRVLEVISILEKYPVTREALESCYSSTFRWSTWDVFWKLSPYWRNIPSQEKLLSHAILLLSGGQHGTCSGSYLHIGEISRHKRSS